MNWTAIGAIGELVGAVAVVVTLLFLALQVRHSRKSMDEANKLERVMALDRHSESISRWRGRIIESEQLSQIWLSTCKDEPLSELQKFQANALFIEFVNTQRANYVRAMAVGEIGLSRQAALSVAVELNLSKTLENEWKTNRAWHAVVSEAFVEAVEKNLEQMKQSELNNFKSFADMQSDDV